jgi:hypothetical protein
MGLTRINNQALTDVTSAGLPSGSVLQVKQGFYDDETNYSGASYQDLTGLSVSITPTSTSSKILIMCNVHCTVNNQHYSIAFKVLRGSTAIGTGDATLAGNRDQVCFMTSQNGGGDHLGSANWQFLDSPSSTSALTYKIQAGSESGAGYRINANQVSNTNTGGNPKFARPTSSITVMEIAG